jgi:hypothetical protein
MGGSKGSPPTEDLFCLQEYDESNFNIYFRSPSYFADYFFGSFLQNKNQQVAISEKRISFNQSGEGFLFCRVRDNRQ